MFASDFVFASSISHDKLYNINHTQFQLDLYFLNFGMLMFCIISCIALSAFAKDFGYIILSIYCLLILLYLFSLIPIFAQDNKVVRSQHNAWICVCFMLILGCLLSLRQLSDNLDKVYRFILQVGMILGGLFLLINFFSNADSNSYVMEGEHEPNVSCYSLSSGDCIFTVNSILLMLVVIVLSVFLLGCSKKSKKNVSSAVLWTLSFGILLVTVVLSMVFEYNIVFNWFVVNLGMILHILLMLGAMLLVTIHSWMDQVTARINLSEKLHSKKKLECQLIQQMLYDPLMGFPNRVALKRKLDQMIQVGQNQRIALMLIYLDGFKEINNTLGHHNGDELLKKVGRRLSGFASQLEGLVSLDACEDKVAPLAVLDGIVFGMLVYNVDRHTESHIGGQVLRCLSYPFEFLDMSLDVTGFLGVASYPENGNSSEDLLQHAFVAVELAQGRDEMVLYYHSDLDPYSAKRLTLVGELKQALRVGGLELYYQPQLDLRNDLIIGFEALVRWNHPKHGFISPAEFIPIAEKTGVIRQLTMWVLETALCEIAQWRRNNTNLRVSVNLSAKNLQETELSAHIMNLIQKYDVSPYSLALEITETAMMLDPVRALKIMEALHEYGIRLCIDDFGTGYSSLAYLKQLPVDEIKIDRSFVSDMCQDNDNQVIVKTTVNMIHSLSMFVEVVAEGVEDEETLDALKALGCDILQGYYLNKPMTINEIKAWIKEAPYEVIPAASGFLYESNIPPSGLAKA